LKGDQPATPPPPELMDGIMTVTPVRAPRLQALCGVVPGDGPAAVSRKLQAALDPLVDELPSDDRRVVASAALGLHPVATGVLTRRIEWLAGHLRMSRRTVMRRIDETFQLLAGIAIAKAPASRSLYRLGEGWVVEELRTLVRLDKPATEVIQERRIVATRDQVDSVNDVSGLPSGAEAAELEVVFGGRLNHLDRRSTRLRYSIELPTALRRGETHSYAIQFRLPEGHPPAPYYVVVPSVYIRDFVLRVRLDPSRLPLRVWRVEDANQREIDHPDFAGEAVRPDRVGEILATFHEPSPGLAHGVALSWTPEPSPGPAPRSRPVGPNQTDMRP
jgi:hypothetical protein